MIDMPTATTTAAKSGRVAKAARSPAHPDPGQTPAGDPIDAPPPAAATSAPRAGPVAARQTKAALLRSRLADPGGVSLAALLEATGWQAHTLRAALSGVRKSGLTVTCRRAGTDTIHALAPAAGNAAEGPADRGMVPARSRT